MTIYVDPIFCAALGAAIGGLCFGAALAGAGVGLGAYLLIINSVAV